MTTLGGKIQRRRKELKMLQRDLAGDSYSIPYICQIEGNKVRPSLKTLEHLAQKLKVSSTYLIDNSADTPQAVAYVEDIGDLFDDISALAAHSTKTDLAASLSILDGLENKLTTLGLDRFNYLCNFQRGKLFYSNGKFDICKFSLENSVDGLLNCNKHDDLAECYLMLGTCWYYESNFYKSESCLQKCLDLFTKANLTNYELKAKCLQNLASASGELNNFLCAYDYYNEILSLANKVNIPALFISGAYAGIGNCFLELKEYETSLPYLLDALSLYKLLRKRENIAMIDYNLGIALLYLNKNADAIEKLNEATQIFSETEDWSNYCEGLGWIGKACLQDDNLSEAESLAKLAFRTAREHSCRAAIGTSCYILALVASRKEKPRSAIRLLRIAEKIFNETGKLNSLPDLYSVLGNLYFKTGAIDAGQQTLNKGMTMLLNKDLTIKKPKTDAK